MLGFIFLLVSLAFNGCSIFPAHVLICKWLLLKLISSVLNTVEYWSCVLLLQIYMIIKNTYMSFSWFINGIISHNAYHTFNHLLRESWLEIFINCFLCCAWILFSHITSFRLPVCDAFYHQVRATILIPMMKSFVSSNSTLQNAVSSIHLFIYFVNMHQGTVQAQVF